jgi:hypothetical protein
MEGQVVSSSQWPYLLDYSHQEVAHKDLISQMMIESHGHCSHGHQQQQEQHSLALLPFLFFVSLFSSLTSSNQSG